MPHVYRSVRSLEKTQKVGDGNCVALVQHYTTVGHTSIWRPGERVMDATSIEPGTVIATFVNGRYLSRVHGNHAALFMSFGPKDAKTGKPAYIVVMDQWARKTAITSRSIWPRGRLHADGGYFDDSDNAEAFYVVK